jgi:hypothetical protein
MRRLWPKRVVSTSLIPPHAPEASFGGDEFYPDQVNKAAVLTCRLAWNHLEMPTERRFGTERRRR